MEKSNLAFLIIISIMSCFMLAVGIYLIVDENSGKDIKCGTCYVVNHNLVESNYAYGVNITFHSPQFNASGTEFFDLQTSYLRALDNLRTYPIGRNLTCKYINDKLTEYYCKEVDTFVLMGGFFLIGLAILGFIIMIMLLIFGCNKTKIVSPFE